MTTKTVYYDRFEDLDSTALNSAFYDALNRELYVEFHGGRIAGYIEVPESAFDELIDAFSAGSFYAHEIKGRYTGTSGDAEFIQRAAYARPADISAVPPGAKTFEVLVEVDGTLKFIIAATGYGDAEQKVKDLLAKALVVGSSSHIKSVTANA